MITKLPCSKIFEWPLLTFRIKSKLLIISARPLWSLHVVFCCSFPHTCCLLHSASSISKSSHLRVCLLLPLDCSSLHKLTGLLSYFIWVYAQMSLPLQKCLLDHLAINKCLKIVYILCSLLGIRSKVRDSCLPFSLVSSTPQIASETY